MAEVLKSDPCPGQLTVVIGERRCVRPEKKTVDGKEYQFLAASDHDVTYKSVDTPYQVYREPFLIKGVYDLSDRAVRLWNAINPTVRAKLAQDGSGWITPFVSAQLATAAEISDALIDIYKRTGRIIVDAFLTDHFKKMQDGTVVCNDVGAALQFAIRREEAENAEMKSVYDTVLPLGVDHHSKIVNTTKALLYLDLYGPDEKNLDALKTDNDSIIKLADAYTQNLKPEQIPDFNFVKYFLVSIDRLTHTLNVSADVATHALTLFPQVCKKLKLDMNMLTQEDCVAILEFMIHDTQGFRVAYEAILLRQLQDKITQLELAMEKIDSQLTHEQTQQITKLKTEIEEIDLETEKISNTREELLEDKSDLNKAGADRLLTLSRLRDDKVSTIASIKGSNYGQLSGLLTKCKNTLDSQTLKIATRIQTTVKFLEEKGIRKPAVDSPEFATLKSELIAKIEDYIRIAHGGYFGITGIFRKTHVTQAKVDDARALINNITVCKSKEEIDRLLIHSQNKDNAIQNAAHKNAWFSGSSRYGDCLSDCLQTVRSYKVGVGPQPPSAGRQ